MHHQVTVSLGLRTSFHFSFFYLVLASGHKAPGLGLKVPLSDKPCQFYPSLHDSFVAYILHMCFLEAYDVLMC